MCDNVFKCLRWIAAVLVSIMYLNFYCPVVIISACLLWICLSAKENEENKITPPKNYHDNGKRYLLKMVSPIKKLVIFHRRVSFQGDIVSLQSVPALFPSSDKSLNDALTKALWGTQVFLLHDRLVLPSSDDVWYAIQKVCIEYPPGN